MRNDFHKVLTERRRGGSTWDEHAFDRLNNFKHRRDRDFLDEYGVEDDFRPTKESMTKRHIVKWQDGKQFSDLINPLERFLFKQVGRPWNKIWSEICQVLKGNGVQQRHVKQHIQGYVYGIPFSGQKWFYGEIGQPNGWDRRDCLYVNEHGILCVRKARRKIKQKKGKK